MEGSSYFNAPQIDTDAVNFEPTTKLPDHLKDYAQIEKDIKVKMNPVVRAISELTGQAALRCAMLPEQK